MRSKFHRHLDECAQCQERPISLCPVGRSLLRAGVIEAGTAAVLLFYTGVGPVSKPYTPERLVEVFQEVEDRWEKAGVADSFFAGVVQALEDAAEKLGLDRVAKE